MISQTAEYALRAMSCLAFSSDELTPTNDLAERTKVPSNYLAKVLQTLGSAELITGRRGVGGGYKLARPASEINLLDVINAVDRVERITACPLGLDNHGPRLCALHRRMDKAAEAIIDIFGSTTLADLVEDSAPSLPLCDPAMTERVRLSVEGSARDKK